MKNINSKSVLVIGWEYPPRMVGGLAIATHSIVKALSNFVHVNLIIPHKDLSTPVDPNITVYGLNSIKEDLQLNSIEEDLMSINMQELMSSRVENIGFDQVSTYPYGAEHINYSKEVGSSSNSNVISTLYGNNEDDSSHKSLSYLNIFSSGEEVYGLGLWQKMDAFCKIAVVISKYIEFDIIHCHDWLTFRAGVEIKKVSKKPLAVHVHSLETDRVGVQNHNEVYMEELKGLEAADVIFPVSNYTKDCIVEYYGIDTNKIVTAYNAIDDEKINRWRHNIPQQIVTFLGRITLQKGPQFLFETIQKVVANYKNVRFVIAGSGDMLEELMMNGAYEQLSRYIIYAGFLNRDEVNALMATTDVFFMPSISEPFGLTALEAGRAGVACVITKQSGVAEILTSALKADFWDTDQFAKQIISLLQDDDKRSKIAQLQMEEIKKVSWDVSAEKIIREYYKLINL